MNTLSKIEEAASKLPLHEQLALIAFLTRKSGQKPVRSKSRKSLKAAAKPPLEGLPNDLSVETKAKVQALIRQRYGPNR